MSRLTTFPILLFGYLDMLLLEDLINSSEADGQLILAGTTQGSMTIRRIYQESKKNHQHTGLINGWTGHGTIFGTISGIQSPLNLAPGVSDKFTTGSDHGHRSTQQQLFHSFAYNSLIRFMTTPPPPPKRKRSTFTTRSGGTSFEWLIINQRTHGGLGFVLGVHHFPLDCIWKEDYWTLSLVYLMTNLLPFAFLPFLSFCFVLCCTNRDCIAGKEPAVFCFLDEIFTHTTYCLCYPAMGEGTGILGRDF